MSKMLESGNHFVRASNIETEGNEPVYAQGGLSEERQPTV